MRKAAWIALAFAFAACSGGSSGSSSGSSGSTSNTTGASSGSSSSGGSTSSGSSGTSGQGAPIISSFAAVPNSVPLGGGTVVLSWSVSGATHLSIDQGVGDVTGLTQKSVAVSQNTSFTLTASNASGQVTATASVTVATTGAVQGTVVDFSGAPFAGATVFVPGKAPTQSDASGHFTISGVTTPYELLMIGTDSNGIRIAQDFQGLTSATPTLVEIWAQSGGSNASLGTTVSGNLTGAGDGGIDVELFGNGVSWSGQSYGPGTYSGTASYAAAPTTASALALETVSLDDGGFTFPRFGRRDGIVLDGGPTVSADIALAPITTGSLEVSASLADGGNFTGSVLLRTDDQGRVSLPGLAGTSSAVIGVPQVGSVTPASLLLQVSATEPAGQSVFQLSAPLTATSLTVPHMAPPLFISPVTNATGVTAQTIFSWQPATNPLGAAGYLVFMQPQTSGSTQYYVFTQATQTKIPDLSPVGVAFPSNQAYHAQVIGLAPASSADAVLTEFLDLELQRGAVVPLGASAAPSGLGFTTAP